MILAPIFFVVLLFVLGIWSLASMSGKRSLQNSTEPKCGQCGYIVLGLSGNTCPACGGDLQLVGIIRQGSLIPLPRWSRFIRWTLFVFLSVFLPATALFATLEPRLPRYYDHQMSDQYFYSPPDPIKSVIISYSTRHFGFDFTPPKAIEVDLTKSSGESRKLEIDCQTMRYAYLDLDGRQHSARLEISQAVPQTWLTDLKIGLTDSVLKELRLVNNSVAKMLDHPNPSDEHLYGNFRSSSVASGGSLERSSSSGSYPRWYSFVSPIFALLVWLIGLKWALRDLTPKTRGQ